MNYVCVYIYIFFVISIPLDFNNVSKADGGFQVLDPYLILFTIKFIMHIRTDIVCLDIMCNNVHSMCDKIKVIFAALPKIMHNFNGISNCQVHNGTNDQ